MGLFFLLASLCASVIAHPGPARWFVGRPSESQLSTLIENNCFHGTYGASSLSVFSCANPGMGLESFAIGKRDSLRCFVEVAHFGEAQRIVGSSSDARILWTNRKEMIVGGIGHSLSYPSICLSRSEFNGSALNVIVIPKHSFKPSIYNVGAGIKPVPQDLISDFIAQVKSSDLQLWDEKLAFGPVTRLEWSTRQSYSSGAAMAVEWVSKEFASHGFDVKTNTFQSPYCANVIAEIKGTTNPEEIVILGSHLDSRSTNAQDPNQVAPGADDNGTGTSINLEFARLIAANKLKFGRTLRLITFCGEEQGLVGSRAEAQLSSTSKENIVVMYNVDMVGWTIPGENPTIAFMSGSTNLNATNECKNLVATYVPSTPTGSTAACCSDQQSYNAFQYPAVGFFETPTSSVVYPHYHRSTDLPEYVNFEQVKFFAQAAYACVLTAARPYVA